MAKKIFIALMILTALLVVAIKFLPWWASILLILGIVMAIRFGGAYLLKRLFMIPFRAKGKVLSGAVVEVHSVSLASEPFREFTSEEEEIYRQEEQSEDQQFTWYFFDLTITPPAKSEGFTHWEPSEVIFSPMGVKANQFEEEEMISKLYDYQIFEDDSFEEDEYGKHQGPLRVKYYAGILPHIKQVQLRYYFELFGNIQIPSST